MPRNTDDLPTLRTSMTVRFLSIFIIFLTIMLITCLVVVITTNKTVRDDSEAALFNQIETNTRRVMLTTVRWLSLYLDAADHALVSVVGLAMADTNRPGGYSMAPQPTYFDYGIPNLPQPTSIDDRQVMLVNFAESTYYVPGSTPATLRTFSAALNDTIARSAHVDPFFASTYTTNPDFYAAYIGFRDDGLYVQYPGKSTLENDAGRTYDPRVRGWYTAARSQPAQASYSSPYRDFFSQKWMITVSRVNRNAAGVSAGDLLLTTLSDTIQRINFLPSGKMSLFETTTGAVVADKEWVIRDAQTSLSYSDLRSPPIPAATWTRISTQAPTGTSNIDTLTSSDGRKYLLVTTRVAGYGDKYALAATVPHDEITAPMATIVDEIKDAQALVIGVVCAVFVVVVAVLVALIFVTSGQILAPIDVMNQNIEQMVKNIGHKDLTANVVDVEGGLGSEQRELMLGFNNMVHVLRESRYENKVANQFYLGQHAFIRAPQANMSVFPDYLPPPQSQTDEFLAHATTPPQNEPAHHAEVGGNRN